MAKRPTVAERIHMDRIAQMGCLVCGGEAAVHHVVSDGYQRITRNHKLVAPLCPFHHQYNHDAVHVIGHRKFTEVHGIDLLKWATLEWERSGV